MPQIELSSKEIRRRVAGGLSIRYQTPRAVEKYIETHQLYR
jgi:nicotinate-nucleotide adenylyltransferase